MRACSSVCGCVCSSSRRGSPYLSCFPLRTRLCSGTQTARSLWFAALSARTKFVSLLRSNCSESPGSLGRGFALFRSGNLERLGLQSESLPDSAHLLYCIAGSLSSLQASNLLFTSLAILMHQKE